MKFKDPVGWAAAIGAGILTTVALIPQARGELVYEENPGVAAPVAPDPRTDDRQNLRQVISASQKAQNTLAAEQPPQVTAPAPSVVMVRPAASQQQPIAQVTVLPAPPVQVYQPVQTAPLLAPAPNLMPVPGYLAQQATTPAVVGGVTSDAAPGVTATAPASPEVQNLSRAELMRRERVREELRNEDVLQERLEQLRLRDEKHRTDELIAGHPLDSAAAAQPAVPVVAGAAPLAPTTVGLQEQMVVAPPVDRPGQPGVAVASLNPPGTAYPGAVPNPTPGQPVYTDQVTSTAAMTTSVAGNPESASEKTMLMITPHAGLSNINVNSAFSVDPHFSAGIGLGIAASDNLAFEGNYSYNQYGIGLSSNNPWIANYQNYLLASGQAGNNLETLNMNQNVFELGAKLSLLGPDSKIRPFIGGGGGYSKSYINYTQQFQQALGPMLGGQGQSSDYDLSQYLGYLSTGVDVRISKSVSIGASFKYYTVLSSSENNSLSYGGFIPTGYGYGYGAGSPVLNSDKSVAGSSLSESSFYTIAGDVSFVF